MNNGAFNINALMKAIELVKKPIWESAELDKFMKNHSDIKNVMLVSSHDGFRDIDYVPTKYGNLKIQYNFYMSPETMHFVAKPDDLLKPDFTFNPTT